MNQKLQILMSVLAIPVLALPTLAQDTANAKKESGDHARERVLRERRADWLNGASKSSDVIGMTVNNYRGQKLGTVEELAFDLESGRIVQVVLSTGGFIGIGDALSAVPPAAFYTDFVHNDLHLDVDKEKLKNAPKFEMSKWAECCDTNHLKEVYRHYGEESSYRFIQVENASSTSHDATLCMIPAARLVHTQKASKLAGTPVKNLRDETIGKVVNTLVDLQSGRIIAVIISSGGFLGIENELSAVPPTAFRFSADRATLELDASKELLSKAPHFTATEWPDFGHAGYVGGVYRSFKVEPYFSTNVSTEAYNKARRVHDLDERTLTPLDQSNTKADLETTAEIRKQIIGADSMSINAKNIKIITIDGKVTLRGPVNTFEEKKLIGEIAIKIARIQNVDNQLEVK